MLHILKQDDTQELQEMVDGIFLKLASPHGLVYTTTSETSFNTSLAFKAFGVWIT